MSKHNHYFKDVSQLSVIDVYRTLILFAVTDPCIQHAVKKLLVAGGRGAGKDISQDIQEAIDSLERWKEMRQEENPIYNRRAGDKIQGYPEVKCEDTYREEPSKSGRTTGKFKNGDEVRVTCVPQYVPEDTYNLNLKGVVTKTFMEGTDGEHYQVTFPDLDNDYWFFNPQEIEHV